MQLIQLQAKKRQQAIITQLLNLIQQQWNALLGIILEEKGGDGGISMCVCVEYW